MNWTLPQLSLDLGGDAEDATSVLLHCALLSDRTSAQLQCDLCSALSAEVSGCIEPFIQHLATHRTSTGGLDFVAHARQNVALEPTHRQLNLHPHTELHEVVVAKLQSTKVAYLIRSSGMRRLSQLGPQSVLVGG